ncbi:MAG: PHP domain-containing protein [Candidatus Diapherotrites archaeon]|nr:PHP domain-containing protein [Candidatus Diapherotrites archaeon]
MKFDLHIHSNYSSDSIMSIEEICKQLIKLKFDGFALTDHSTISGIGKARVIAKKYDLVFIPGVEVGTSEGHILAYGIEEQIPRGLPAIDTIEIIHENGGVAVAPHPYGWFQHGIGDLVYKLKLEGIETRNGKAFVGNEKAEEACRRLQLAETGGSDAHSLAEIGNAWTECSQDVIKDIKKKKTKARGGFRFSSITSRFVRRMKGAWPTE